MIYQDGAGSVNFLRVAPPDRFSDMPVSWAGEGRDNDFCFGGEDGQLRFTAINGASKGQFSSGEKDTEAVNGVAFIDKVIAISNRREVVLWEPEEPRRLVIPWGAHGVIATANGYFIAPLGRAGLMKARPLQSKEQPVVVTQARQQKLDFYKVVSLYSANLPQILVCAARRGGVAATEWVPEGNHASIRSVTSSVSDVVDVCSLATGRNPPAVAALDRSGSLILLRDVLSDESPVSLSFPAVAGVGYRVFCFQGSIVMLTSAGLYILGGLARRFLEGESFDFSPTRVRAIPLEAVDANLCWGRWLLVVLPDGVLRFDLDLLAADLAAGGPIQSEPASNKPVPISPVWEFHQELMTVST